MRRVRVLSLLALLLAPAAARGQADPLHGFDSYVREAMHAWNAVGLSVAVVKDGAIVFEEGYGVRALGDAAPVDEHTLFAIGSTTKAMTAAAIGMLVDEGKVQWEDRVTKHLPWFELRDPWVTRELTVRDLLTHRAGLPNADFLWYEQDADARDILERLRLVDAAYSLRSGFIYQNLMYATAGAVVAAASGQPWEEFVNRRIFGPLGMTRTVATLAGTRGVENVAAPHEEVDGVIRVIENATVDPVAPAGSVWSSAHDMGKWIAFLLRDCTTEDGTALIQPDTCSELFRPQAIVPPSGFYPSRQLTNPHWMTYGLGWFQQDYEGRKVDFHTGSIDGMVAIAGLLRDESAGVLVLGNLDHVEVRHALMYRVFDLYDAEPPRDWSAELLALYAAADARADSARARAEARRPTGTSPTLPLESYAGTYADPLYGAVTVTYEARGLRVRYGRLSGPLEHWGYDTFRVRWDTEWRGNALLAFRIGPQGEVTALEIQGRELRRR